MVQRYITAHYTLTCRYISFILLVGLGIISCDSKSIYRNIHTLKGPWSKTQKISFTYANAEKNAYDMFIILRNDDNFKYSNLFLIVEMELPDGKVMSDTLEYAMSDAKGKWLGSGLSSVKEHLLWYKENIRLDSVETYKIDISQAMRKNGTAEGIEQLEGLLDIGLEVRKHEYHTNGKSGL